MAFHFRPCRPRPFVTVLFGCMVALAPLMATAASSANCEGGGFTILRGAAQPPIAGEQEARIAARTVGDRFTVKGRYVQFDVVAATFGIENYRFLSSGAPGTQTLGGDAPVFERKTPDHRGLVLTGDIDVELKDDSIELFRTGTRLSMKIQAKDCTQGGLFQMEPERADGTVTRITHVLAPQTFYFDNPRFRARAGERVPFNPSDPTRATTVVIAPRINFGNVMSPEFVGRDSPQVATRVQPRNCSNVVPAPNGATATVRHCGRESVWDVASGGRMGMVTGEDAVEVAPPPTECVQNCQAQNRVRGGALVLGFPFPIPDNVKLRPPFDSAP